MEEEFQQLNLFAASYEKPKLPKHIRLIEFFAGIGAQAKGLEILGADFEHWRTCEWSWQSITAYNAIHMGGRKEDVSSLSYEEVLEKIKGVSNDYSKPMTETELRRRGEPWARDLLGRMLANRNYCPNVSELSWKDLGICDREKNSYILTYSFPCGLPGEKVKTDCGYKKIENILDGDMVLTHNGRYRKVLRTMQKTADGYYKIKAVGAADLRLTGNHPLYVLRDGELQWVQVMDVRKGDYLVYNVNQEEKDVPLDKETLWLLGRYVADGVVISDKNLLLLCSQFGTGAKNKIIPQWVIDLPKGKLQAFFDGYISGDGHKRDLKANQQVMFSTVSEDLFLALEEIVIKLYGKIPTIYIRKDGRKETFNDSYNAQFCLGKTRFQKVDDRYAYGMVKGIEKVDEEVPVFNLEVEEDNTYTLQNVVVHNCTDLSNAGKMLGMDKGSGTRSGLLWEVERILLECQENGCLPQVLLMENVPAVCGTKNLKAWNQWLDALEHMGYTNYYKVLNGKDYGIPQNRRRCFMVSLLGEYSFHFPKKTELRYLLKDFIEKKVDESYYLSDELVKGFEKYVGGKEEDGE